MAGNLNPSFQPGAIPGVTSANADAPMVGQTASGPMVQAIQQGAYDIIAKHPGYSPGTNNGRLGCADMISAALMKAGILDSRILGVVALMDALKAKGWQTVHDVSTSGQTGVSPSQVQAGDVVTISTYDRDGDGDKDPYTHVGIVVNEGGRLYFVNNSSSQGQVVKTPLDASRLTSVQRPPATAA